MKTWRNDKAVITEDTVCMLWRGKFGASRHAQRRALRKADETARELLGEYARYTLDTEAYAASVAIGGKLQMGVCVGISGISFAYAGKIGVYRSSVT